MKEDPETRSRIMRAVKGQNTTPELVVRRLVFASGYRYRLHRKDLPGKPDLVFPGLRKIIFVHGCFWHGHTCARGARIPQNNRQYWIQKIERNVIRDRKNRAALKKLGWEVHIIWECDLKEVAKLQTSIGRFLKKCGPP
jgi:DNA mismatch endonuclease, patch repair protein